MAPVVMFGFACLCMATGVSCISSGIYSLVYVIEGIALRMGDDPYAPFALQLIPTALLLSTLIAGTMLILIGVHIIWREKKEGER